MMQRGTEPQLHTSTSKRKIEDLRKLLSIHEHKHKQMNTSVSLNNFEMTSHHKSDGQITQLLPQKALKVLEKQKTARSSRKLSQKLKIMDITQLTSRVPKTLTRHSTEDQISMKENVNIEANVDAVIHHKPTTKQIQIRYGKEQKNNSEDAVKKFSKKVDALTQALETSQKQNARLNMEIQFQEKSDKRAAELLRQVRGLEVDKVELLSKNTVLETELSLANRQIKQYRQQVQELYINIEIMRRSKQDKNKQIQTLIQKNLESSKKIDEMRSCPIPPVNQVKSPRSYQINHTSGIPKNPKHLDKKACFI